MPGALVRANVTALESFGALASVSAAADAPAVSAVIVAAQYEQPPKVRFTVA